MLELAKKINEAAATGDNAPANGKVMLSHFTKAMPGFQAEIAALKAEVQGWAKGFFMPGL
jgi:hypothetical protein